MSRRDDDRGAILVLMALVITVLVIIAAIVVDLGATRSDRRGGQLAADTAVASAAVELANSNSSHLACEAAFDYLEATLGVVFGNTPTCASLLVNQALCTATTIEGTVRRTDASGDYTAVVHYPVPAASGLMDRTSTIGGVGTIAADADDGLPCERIGIEVITSGDSFFGGIVGTGDRTSTVHAVGRGFGGGIQLRPINLLVLDRTSCETFVANGGASVIVQEFFDDGEWQPGTAGVDSDGAGCAGPGNATIAINGGPGRIIARGPCPDGTIGNCGVIQTFAPVSDGSCSTAADYPGCDEQSGSIEPDVTEAARLTREPLDHEFNCKASYASEAWAALQPINGCADAATNRPYVDELFTYISGVMAAAPPPAGWTVISGGACSPSGVVPPYVGNVYVDCGNFRVNGAVVEFTDGNVIFRNDVTVTGTGGSLTVHSCAAASTCASTSSSWTAGTDFDESTSSNKNAWAYIGGQLRNNATAAFHKTAVFFGPAGRLDQQGGSSLTWSAPDEDGVDDSAGPFDVLAMWSEGTAAHGLQGGGALDLEGTFFAGRARLEFGGTSDMTLTEAQFIGYQMQFSGSNLFTMAPAAGRSIPFPLDPEYSLIR